jgi:hypothetical protein
VEDYEKLGAFYLGRPYDIEVRAPLDGLVLYDSRDLTTHGVIIGMTGSGKTGLAIGLLEEAAIDGVPAIAIDPKGDLGNLLLGFPGLSAPEFRPWVNEDEAARRGLTPDQFAEQQAQLWKDGLAAWGQDGTRLARLRDAADLAIYTPGSSAGIGLSILRSFAAPPPEVRDDHELFAERVGTSVTGLLSLVGIAADPVRSREHILLSTIVGGSWKAGEDLDLGALIHRIQTPPVSRIGVLEVESFYPSRDRFELAMRLNGLLAAPGFAAWLEGDPIDVDRLLYTEAGKPRVSVVSIAHLGDAERMFVVSLLLNEIVGWMRRQPGTTSLRAILYMDEVAGYLPPVANPPSKTGFMTLIKQARAFGLGVVLATQNPADLDYKALSNTGTWMIGRLQTDRDKSKVLEGLEGALGGTGRFDRAGIDRVLGALGKRLFLLHNVHDAAPVVFETRWTLSYLSGPLTRDQIRRLTVERARRLGGGAGAGEAAAAAPDGAAPRVEPVAESRVAGQGAGPATAPRPVLPSDVPQFFVPVRARGAIVYAPHLFAAGRVQFVDARLAVNVARDVAVIVPFTSGPVPVDFAGAVPTDLTLADLEVAGEAGAAFASLPPAATRAKSYDGWSGDFARWLHQSESLDLLRDPVTGATSKPGESERDFRIRLQLAWREKRDADITRLRERYAPKRTALEDRLRRARDRVAREADQASHQKIQTALSFGASVLGTLFSSKKISTTNIGRVATAARSASRTMKESKDVAIAAESVEALEQQARALDAELDEAIAALDARADASGAPLETVSVQPRKAQITVQKVVLAWMGG